MPLRTAYSTKALPEAVADLVRQGEGMRPSVVLYFASTKYDPAALAVAMKAAFPNTVLVGCSTAGEMVTGKMLTGSVVAMFLDSDVVADAVCVVVENLSTKPTIDEAFARLEEHFGFRISSLDMVKHAGIVLIDGLSGAEERLMERIGDRCDLLFVGGSAGDDLRFQQTSVWLDDKVYHDAAVLLLFRLRNGFDVLKTQSFARAGTTLTATQVDVSRRLVVEFDGRPALDAYAQALGVSPEQAPSLFMRHPLGLMAGREPYVRSPRAVEGSGVAFYCHIRQGQQLELLQARDIVADTRSALAQKKAQLGHIIGLIDFQCILRTLQLRQQNQVDAYASIFSDIPAVGFSTYGEQFLGHMNQTSTMLLFH